MLSARISPSYSLINLQENTSVTKDPKVKRVLINVDNEPSRDTAWPVRDIESARPPQASNGPKKSGKGLIWKVLLSVVGGLAVVACGIASATIRRSDAFGVQRVPVPNRLIMSPEHQLMIESIPFGNETALLDKFIRAPRTGIAERLNHWTIDNIGGEELARDGEIKRLYPQVFEAIEEARKGSVAVLEATKNRCTQSCDSPMPVRVNATQEAKDVIGAVLYDMGVDESKIESQIEPVFDNLLSEMGTSRESFAQRETYTSPDTNEIDFKLKLTKNPCHLESVVGECIQYILVKQTPEGIQRDRDDNRPATYAATVHPVISLIGDKYPIIIITNNIEDPIKHPMLFKHIITHEVDHYTGSPDIFYTGIDRAILNNTQGDDDKKTYLKKCEELRADMPDIIKNSPDSMQPAAGLFFDTHGRDDPDMGMLDKKDKLEKLLASNDTTWDAFIKTSTDFKTMGMHCDYLQEQESALLISDVLDGLGM